MYIGKDMAVPPGQTRAACQNGQSRGHVPSQGPRQGCCPSLSPERAFAALSVARLGEAGERDDLIYDTDKVLRVLQRAYELILIDRMSFMRPILVVVFTRAVVGGRLPDLARLTAAHRSVATFLGSTGSHATCCHVVWGPCDPR